MTDGPHYHVCCRTCASDDDAREALGIRPYEHETLTRNPDFAELVTELHEAADHDVRVARL